MHVNTCQHMWDSLRGFCEMLSVEEELAIRLGVRLGV